MDLLSEKVCFYSVIAAEAVILKTIFSGLAILFILTCAFHFLVILFLYNERNQKMVYW